VLGHDVLIKRDGSYCMFISHAYSARPAPFNEEFYKRFFCKGFCSIAKRNLRSIARDNLVTSIEDANVWRAVIFNTDQMQAMTVCIELVEVT